MRLRFRAFALGLLAAAGVHAQVPATVFDGNTQVRSLDFKFPSGRTIRESLLRQQIVLSDPGALAGLRRKLAFIPLVPDVGRHPFAPLELQRDVARLRRFYSEAGFLGTTIRYEVDYDQKPNNVAVNLIIAEGRPIRLQSIVMVTASGGSPARLLPDSLGPEWEAFVRARVRALGRTFTEAERGRQAGELLGWMRDRGWAFAQVTTETHIDSTTAIADLRMTIDPGPRARIDSIEITGNTSVDDDVVRQALSFEEGDWFTGRELAASQRRVFGLDLFRLALINVPSDQPRDSTVLVRIRLEEAPPRLVTGEVGYAASGGITAQGQFAHRNFFGGARTLRVTGLAQTGTFAVLGDQADKQYQLSVAYRWPYLFYRGLSLNVAPFGNYRDNVTDRSYQVGLETALLWELGPNRFLTLQHRFSGRQVLEYRLGSGNAIDLVTLTRLRAEGAIDSLGTRVDRSTLSLSATVGRSDRTSTTPTAQIRPSIEVTFPPGLNTIQFSHIEVPVNGRLPFWGRFALIGSVRAGRVIPFGKTLRGDSVAGLLESIELRDVLLSAGGTGSVRGWGTGTLGPKFVNLLFVPIPGTDSSRVETNGYAPSGGLARVAGSVELQMPFPGLGEQWGTHVFLDAGKVWTPDRRFRGEDPDHEQRLFAAAGFGVNVRTPVGPVKLSLGYKLNPSALDLRGSNDVLQALLAGQSVESVPTKWSHRLHLHIALGATTF